MKEQRKLAAIMFTDIVGYTALMSKDEQHAHQIIHKSRDILKGLIEQYNGELLQVVGDGTLSSFASVVDAVNCALEIQRSIRREPELSLRIGIHIGDVVFAEGEVYGDGVNVASRLEPLADPGGICISGQVYRNIRNKPGIEAIFMGEKTLKNVDLPMKVYALAVEELPAALAKSQIARKLTKLKPRPYVKRTFLYVGGAALVAILVVAGYLLWQRVGEPPVPRLSNPTRVTTSVGVEDYPAWSPDGGRLAYQSNQSGSWDIWVTQVRGGTPVNLTADYKGADRCPSWSPDGRQIAFWSERDGGGYFVMSALGGSPRKVTDMRWWKCTNPPQWSADGRELACVVVDSAGLSAEIVSIQRAASRRFRLPGKGHNGWELNWSPDGRYFAYVSAAWREWPISQLWVLRVEDEVGFSVTDGRTWDWSPSWSLDSRYLYFVSNRGGSKDLWQQQLGDNGTPRGLPQRVTMIGEMQYAIFSPDEGKLAYSKGQAVRNVWRVPILEDRPATWADAQQLTFEQADIVTMDLSPDGKRLVFRMDRDGKPHLWVMPVEGGELQRVTPDPMSDAWPRWSPDGREIAFHSRWAGNRDIWVVPVSGGAARQVTRHEAGESEPAWSPDGREIAFSSGRSGNSEIWVIPAQGGEARQVTDYPEYEAFPDWSPDGQWLLFLSNRTGDPRVWRVPAAGGNPEPVTKENAGLGVWSKYGKKVYFNAYREEAWNFWEVPAEGGNERQLTDLAGKPGGDFFVRPATDGQYLYFNWREDLGDIWVMDVVK